MNTERTYGIEIECYSSLNHQDLAAQLGDRLRDFGHTALATQWQSNTDRMNTTRWTVKTDSSLNRSCPVGRVGVEIVSPVLRGREGLRLLQVVCDVVSEHCIVNAACGLHIHHGVNSSEIEDVARAWMEFEPYVMQAMPASRRNNDYCVQWRNITNEKYAVHRRPEIARAKYRTLNLRSFQLRGTIEFRCHSGTTEHDKISNWLLVTQGIIEAAVTGNLPPHATSIQDVANYVSQPGNGTADLTELRRRYRQIRRQIVDLIAQRGPMTIDQIAAALDYRRPTNAMRTFLQHGTMTLSNGYYSLAGGGTGTADEDFVQASSWLLSRHQRFAA